MPKRFQRRTFRTHQGREFSVTYCRITGKQPGPSLALIGGQHGMEHIGPMMLTQLVDEIADDQFSGTLTICPCANPMALEVDYEFYPEKEDLTKLNQYFYSRFRHDYCVFDMGRHQVLNYYNMNRLWERQGEYGVAGQITRWLWDEMIQPADLAIDFHCLQSRKPLIYGYDLKANALARYFGAEVIVMVDSKPDDFEGHSLSYRANRRPDQYCFCVEFCRQHEVVESQIAWGKRGVRNVMRSIGMCEGSVVLDRPVYVVGVDDRTPMKAGATGHVHFHVELYDPVKKGDLIYEIRGLETLDVLERGYSPLDGIMEGPTHLPVIKPGGTVCWVGAAQKIAEAHVPLAPALGLWKAGATGGGSCA
jgi:predicted deacylase